MKKLFLLVMLTAMSALIACGAAKTQTLKQFFTVAKIEQVNKIVIQDGSTGYAKTIDQEEQIDAFLALMNQVEFTPQEKQEKRDGWRYRVTLYDQEKLFTFTTEQIGKTYYDTSPDILPIVDEYYRALEVEEE